MSREGEDELDKVKGNTKLITGLNDSLEISFSSVKLCNHTLPFILYLFTRAPSRIVTRLEKVDNRSTLLKTALWW